MRRLENKTALVTGGTSGIGLATAEKFVAEGAYVIVTGRDQGRLDAAVKHLGAGAEGVRADVSDPDELDRVVAAVEARGRGLDVLFANAGGGEFAPLDGLSRDHYERTFGINVGGTVFTVQKLLPVFNRGASIVLNGSTAGSKGTPAFGVYAASKAAIRSFGRTWANELAGRGIRVNTLAAGPTETPGLAGLSPDDAAGLFRLLGDGVALKRTAQASEIAEAVTFLASDQASYMTGSELVVDGGELVA